jgi:hypothetical protein
MVVAAMLRSGYNLVSVGGQERQDEVSSAKPDSESKLDQPPAPKATNKVPIAPSRRPELGSELLPNRSRPKRKLGTTLEEKRDVCFHTLSSLSRTVTLVSASSHGGPVCKGCYACFLSILHDGLATAAWPLSPCS